MKARNGFLKRLSAAALAAGVIVGALAVNARPALAADKLAVTKEKYEKNYTLEDGTVFFETSYEYPVVSGDSAAAKKINSYISKKQKAWVKQAEKAKDEYEEQTRSYLEMFPDEGLSWPCSDVVTYEVTTNDGNYFSVVMSGYLYTGGAHGMPYRACATFDAKTGERLTAAKILATTKAKLNAKVRKLYLNMYDKKGAEAGFYGYGEESGREALVKTLKSMNFNSTFYMKGGKLVFYADPYVLGPYAAGFMEVSASAK